MDKRRFKILAVDDTKTNISILLELLGEDYDIVPATSGAKALEIVKKIQIDLILLDIMMPEMDGYEVCKILKSEEKTKDIPILFITAKVDEESIVDAFKVGGVDYVTKPFQPFELIARIQTHLKLSDTLKSLEFLATRDSMTGILNRRKFFELGEAKFKNNKNNLYVVMVDIDKFKAINDTYGHAIGDEVIKVVAKSIEDKLPNGAIFGRIGGEEFAIILDTLMCTDIDSTIEAIRSSVESLAVISYGDEIINITISQGVAKASPDSECLDIVLKDADEALYEAKNSGRNRSVFRKRSC